MPRIAPDNDSPGHESPLPDTGIENYITVQEDHEPTNPGASETDDLGDMDHPIHLSQRTRAPSAARFVLLTIIFGTYTCIVVSLIGTYVMSYIPDGPLDKDGNLKLISHGLRVHPLEASLIYGITTACLGVVYVLALVMFETHQCKAVLNMFLLAIVLISATMAIRTDLFHGPKHDAAAGTWLVASVVLQGLTLPPMFVTVSVVCT